MYSYTKYVLKRSIALHIVENAPLKKKYYFYGRSRTKPNKKYVLSSDSGYIVVGLL